MNKLLLGFLASAVLSVGSNEAYAGKILFISKENKEDGSSNRNIPVKKTIKKKEKRESDSSSLYCDEALFLGPKDSYDGLKKDRFLDESWINYYKNLIPGGFLEPQAPLRKQANFDKWKEIIDKNPRSFVIIQGQLWKRVKFAPGDEPKQN
ncbi:MAG TPA: hypothetical protein VMW10_02870 [Alphaproteobacteria bacterium]|nr:hypothetical protein [Alphaproteobacteria bacterium]